MEALSIFDMIKIGIGPSSSHTMGPWRASLDFLKMIHKNGLIDELSSITIHLYGSLAKTGKGHGTDIAVMMGLVGAIPESFDADQIDDLIQEIETTSSLRLGGEHAIAFDPAKHIVFHQEKSLDYHPNGMTYIHKNGSRNRLSVTYYSTGGGFIVKEGDQAEEGAASSVILPYPITKASDITLYASKTALSLEEIILENEQTWATIEEIHTSLDQIWEVMLEGMYKGCHTSGILPGGLKVQRRACKLNERLLEGAVYLGRDEWMEEIKSHASDFRKVLKWVSCFAIAVNEQNAAFKRVVTAPTNGASGVLPAVIMYMQLFTDHHMPGDIRKLLLVAGEIACLFKKGATISAAMGGCQAEIGVSSAMAAGGLTACMGGSTGQILMAAEIAMEHHLGLTCDPIGGLVQIPCIERNSMGAIKAITASQIALESNPEDAKISLDLVIKTMWETARDMDHKYKETAEGGLAVQIGVNLSEC